MKEITRIHIAKISYDIEVKAKKELEAYLKTLEAYSNDTEIINDVELRITEILSERGVQKNGVIASDDVAALTQQLGEPREFMDDSDVAIEPEDEVKISGKTSRKLYRDTDNAILGGVLSGIAAFFNINPVWVRLLFIVLAIASFGTAFLVYIVLSIVVPPARTAADKLQMTGRPVTARAIRQQNEQMAKTATRKARDTRRVGLVLLGIGSTAAAAIAAMVTIGAGIAILFAGRAHYFSEGAAAGFLMAATILAIISGLLLTTLFIVTAYASFAQKMTRRIIVSICVIVAVGLATFGTVIGLIQYGSFQQRQLIQSSTHENTITLPEGIKNVTSLEVSGTGARVKYIVTTDQPHATIRTIQTDDTKAAQPTVSIENNLLKVHVPALDNDVCATWWCEGLQVVTIYGPALTQVAADEGVSLEYEMGEQNSLTAIAEKDATIELAGTMEKLIVKAADRAHVTAQGATVRHVEADVRILTSLRFGAIETLKVTDLNSCPAHERMARVRVEKVMSGTMQLNDTTLPAATHNSGCTEIEIENRENQ
jgi:phage shock protein PspC (stress-responsive transcriptional regulator)